MLATAKQSVLPRIVRVVVPAIRKTAEIGVAAAAVSLFVAPSVAMAAATAPITVTTAAATVVVCGKREKIVQRPPDFIT